jgi:hypothetical protein
LRSSMYGFTILPGSGLLTIDDGSQMVIAEDPAMQPQIWEAQATLEFGNIGASSCTPPQVIQLPGALANDLVVPGWPGAIPIGVFGQMQVSSVNQVSVSLCNLSGTSQSLGPLLFQAAVLRQFSYYTPLSSGAVTARREPRQRPLRVDTRSGTEGAVEGINYCYIEPTGARENCATVMLPNCQAACGVTLQVPEGYSLKYRFNRSGALKQNAQSNWVVVRPGAQEMQQ